jgi:arylsulfatase A-like enzyme
MLPRLLVLPLLAVVGCAGEPATVDPVAPVQDRPNIVLITVESVRSDHVGCFGYDRDTMPSLCGLAAEGTRFDNAYSVTSWTLPAHASLFTGLYPAVHQVIGSRGRLDDAYTTLAEVLAGAGYQTAGFVSGPFLQPQHNLNQGFEIYDASPSNPGGNRAAHADVTNPAMEALIDRFLAEGRDDARPLFLFVYLWDPHYDYIPPSPFDAAFLPPDAVPIDLTSYETSDEVHPGISTGELAYVISQYDGELSCTDAWIGRLWRRLRDVGLWDDTYVIVTSDHGEEFFEHGNKGHRNNLYEESVHVPLIIKFPGTAAPPEDDRPVSLVDLFPTVLDFAGVDPPVELHGRSLIRAPDPDRTLFLELLTEWAVRNEGTGELELETDLWLAARAAGHKLVMGRNENRVELFDLASDPGERRPLGPEAATRREEIDARLGEHLRRMKVEVAGWRTPEPARLSPEQEERLRALGYLGGSSRDDD